jgi:hypothetical protein
MRALASVALGLAISAATLIAAQAAAADARFEKSLRTLGSVDRLEQLCDYTAMAQIRQDAGNFRPDRAIADAISEPRLSQDSIEAKGGAFRSRGKWYALAYACAATPDHLKVTSFRYTIGAEIPETKWAGYGLWE